MPELRDQARNKWRSILPALGIRAEFLTGKHTACPICAGGRDRFRFDDLDGNGTWFCNQCRAGSGIDLLMKVHGWTFPETAARVREILGECPCSPPGQKMDPTRAMEAASALWERGLLVTDGDMLTQYLRGRGLTGSIPLRLRFLASCRVSGHPTRQYLPAMLALISGPEGQPVNVHRTYLENGAKAQMESPRKIMAGSIPDGSAIRLGEPRDGKLGIAEGIETALAVTQRFGIPCWSAMNSTMLAKFVPPSGLREFHVFGDNDRKLGGQAAAYTCGHRAAVMRDGPRLWAVHIPTKIDTDWADGLPNAAA
jgi:putative DNA primase/helicase